MISSKLSLFIFRRDLRLEDNTALNAALSAGGEVMASFIVDPRQAEDHPYRSTNALQFMIASLKEIDAALQARGGRLYLFYGKAEEVVARLLKEGIGAVYFNRDYTPFSVKRDLAIQRACEAVGAGCHMFDDALLNAPGSVIKDAGGPYTVFTPFFKRASQIPVAQPQALGKGCFGISVIKGEDPQALEKVASEVNPSLAVLGGRGEALKLLKQLSSYKNYDEQRDILAEPGTTRLSAHLKFGTASVREVHQAICKTLGAVHPLTRQLYWRDFFSHIAYHFPHVFGGSFYEQYDRIDWSKDEVRFQLWCEGKTGFPIVDAGMRELNATGLMHNRARMITASFLVKDLHLDWRKGERYFAQKLVDYDPAVNNGNWQWAASTGCDHQPYFRIFNPWRQQERFDPDCRYIKRWVPELQSLASKAIHSLYKGEPCLGYPVMIVDHATQAEKAKQMYRSKG